jgi:hypothetical protein
VSRSVYWSGGRRAPHRPAVLPLQLRRSPSSGIFYQCCIADHRPIYQPSSERFIGLKCVAHRPIIVPAATGRGCSFWCKRPAQVTRTFLPALPAGASVTVRLLARPMPVATSSASVSSASSVSFNMEIISPAGRPMPQATSFSSPLVTGRFRLPTKAVGDFSFFGRGQHLVDQSAISATSASSAPVMVDYCPDQSRARFPAHMF